VSNARLAKSGAHILSHATRSRYFDGQEIAEVACRYCSVNTSARRATEKSASTGVEPAESGRTAEA
jgi:hypothetical protein